MKYCVNHPDRIAYSVCGNCRESYCKECLNEGEQFLYCNKKECKERFGPVEANSQTVLSNKTELVGVGGWLFLFALQLTVLTPLWSLINMVADIKEYAPIIDAFPSLLTGIVINTIMTTSLLGYGIYCGVLIFKEKSQAIMMAKRYLVAFILYAVIEYPIIIGLSGLPSEANRIILSEAVGVFFKALIYVIIWYLYLTKSKRVENTFAVTGTDNSDEEESQENKFAYSNQKNNYTGNDATFSTHSSSIAVDRGGDTTYDLEQYKEIDESYLSDIERDKVFAKVLGLKGKLTKNEIKKIYKEMIEKYHPDKVSHLGEEFQMYALKKTKDINKAYNFFKKKYNII